ncbi:MAG: glutathione S-transferase family protein, partial [Alphaproteobacteria bacterium]
MKLYSGPLSMFGAKAQIALGEKGGEKGINFELEMVPFSLKTLYEPKHEVVARVNPKGQVPVLVDGDLEIFDSTQIFEYLEDKFPTPALWPADPVARARARQWELKSDEVFFSHVITLMSQFG